LQAAPFLMAATIIIYAGAIIVTFLFVIMLAQQEGISSADYRSREPLLSCVAGFVLLVALFYTLGLTYDTRRLDDLLGRTAAAEHQETEEQMRRALGNEREFFAAFRDEAQKQQGTSGSAHGLQDAVSQVESIWSKSPVDVKAMHGALDELYLAAFITRNRYGSVLPVNNGKYLAGYDRLPSPEPGNEGPRDASGRAQLPAENVGYLGRMLFTEFLVPVELGGTLLLVATIGAIAIASRRTEALR
jgi:NADH:ubiquinone oxidoreductase subunit 6 (subunit J)